MTNALIKKISSLLEKHHIGSNDINAINASILKQLNDTQNLHILIENHIAHIVKKYGINYLDIYELNNQIWTEVMHFKFLVISLKCKRKRTRL